MEQDLRFVQNAMKQQELADDKETLQVLKGFLRFWNIDDLEFAIQAKINEYEELVACNR